MTIIDNDLLSIQKARILAENAREAQRRLALLPQEKLDAIVARVAEAVAVHAEALARMSQDETDYGNWRDKIFKTRFVCGPVHGRLRGMRCVGVIGEDREKRILDIGVPAGVLVALCPATSPVSTTLYKTLIALKSGNAILFSPHPRAFRTMCRVLDIMTEAAHSCGLPEGCLAYLDTVTRAGTVELMGHGATSLILNTGVPGLLQAAWAAGKPVIYGGMGNGPAFIERTADIRQAVRDIIESKTFDHGIAPSAEQSIVVDACIAGEVKRALQEEGAYFMSAEEAGRFAAMYFSAQGKPNARMVGVSAGTLARRAGFSVPEGVRVLIAERRYVMDADPYAEGLLCPVLPYYVEDDWMHACEKCIELLLSGGKGHSLVIHSRDEAVIRQFALKKPVGRMLVNTPAAFGGMGMTTNLFPSMTLGSGSAGEGITSDNVSPMNLIYVRRVGYGVRTREALLEDFPEKNPPSPEGTVWGEKVSGNSVEALRRILQEAIRVMERQDR